MSTICIISSQGVDLLNTKIMLNGQTMECCGLAKQEYKDDRLWQWWIVMEVE